MLLPGLDAKQTPVSQVMTANPVTVKPDDRLDGCMAMMATRGFRHLPVLDAGKVVGVISIGDVVKNIDSGFGAERERPDGLHHAGTAAGGLLSKPRCRRPPSAILRRPWFFYNCKPLAEVV